MAQAYYNQRDKKDVNRRNIKEQTCFTSVNDNESDKLKTIEILNSDCLEQIFRFLPVVDLFKVQRVCKFWKMVSLDICHRLTRLEMSRNFWGVTSEGNIHIDFGILAHVLCICGLNLHHISLSNDEDSYSVEFRRIHVESEKKLWILIQNKCPSLTSIDFGPSRSVAALKLVSHAFKDLTYFKMKKFGLPGKSSLVHETHLCDLFANHEHLKRVDFFDAELTTECLTKLHPTNFVELTLDKCMIHNSEYLVKALTELKKLQKLRMTRCTCLQETWINSVLNALTSISDSLKYLEFYPYNPSCEVVDPTYIGKLKQLEYLGIAGDSIIGGDVLEVIAERCRNLKTLQIYNCKMIDDVGFEKIAQLQELKNLVLDNLSNLTDESLSNIMNIENLEVHRCANFRNNGILNVITNSQSIRSLKIFHCKDINEVQLIEEAERCSNDNLELIIDSSETSSDFFKSISKLRKSKGKVMKMTRKICGDCFVEGQKKFDCHLCCNILESNF